jgi:hypothetical protein
MEKEIQELKKRIDFSGKASSEQTTSEQTTSEQTTSVI